MRVGIIGAGHIARKMAQTIIAVEGFTPYAIASRSMDKALAFKEEFGFERAYASYEELVSDKNVDLVYIATVHSAHYEHMLLCLKHNKPVLCEKAFTTCSKDTKEIYSLFEKQGLYVSEALWTSFMPSRKIINDLIKEEIVGKIKTIEAFFEVSLMHKERVNQKALGGGVAMDIGVYPISFIQRILGFDYDELKILSKEVVNEVDTKEILEFTYGNIKAKCIVDGTIKGRMDVVINCEKGTIRIDSVNSPDIIEVLDINNNVIKKLQCGPKFGGFEYELIETKRAIENHQYENEFWTHNNSIRLSEVVDKLI